MDARDWLYVKIFVGLYVIVTALVAVAGAREGAWQVGMYVAVAGTLMVAGGLTMKEWIGKHRAS
jgi:hypothetical protein